MDVKDTMLDALKLAERNAASRLHMLSIYTDATTRASLESELAIYRDAIAKAEAEPDMLAALKLFRDWSDQDGDDDQLDAAMRACRSVILEAEGEKAPEPQAEPTPPEPGEWKAGVPYKMSGGRFDVPILNSLGEVVGRMEGTSQSHAERRAKLAAASPKMREALKKAGGAIFYYHDADGAIRAEVKAALGAAEDR